MDEILPWPTEQLLSKITASQASSWLICVDLCHRLWVSESADILKLLISILFWITFLPTSEPFFEINYEE